MRNREPALEARSEATTRPTVTARGTNAVYSASTSACCRNSGTPRRQRSSAWPAAATGARGRLRFHSMPRQRHKASARARRKQGPPPDQQGQRLDAACTAFRAEWQAKVDRKRRQAAQPREFAAQIRRNPMIVPIAGGCVGAIISVAVLLLRQYWSSLPLAAGLGFIFGLGTTIPLISIALGATRLWDRWADPCEQSAKLMELRQHRNAR